MTGGATSFRVGPADDPGRWTLTNLLGGQFSFWDYMVWNEIPTVLGNLMGGLTFVGLTLYATHRRTAPSRRQPAAVGTVREVSPVAAE